VLEEIRLEEMGGVQTIYQKIGDSYLDSFPQKVKIERMHDNYTNLNVLMRSTTKFGMNIIQIINDSKKTFEIRVDIYPWILRKYAAKPKFILQPEGHETIIFKSLDGSKSDNKYSIELSIDLWKC